MRRIFKATSDKAVSVVCGTAAAIAMLVLSEASQAYTYKTLYSFCAAKKCADGSQPMGELAMDESGNLYGTTHGGGLGHTYRDPGWGTAFEFMPAAGQYAVLHKFDIESGDGAWPLDVKLVIDTAGNLYGTTSTGGNGSGSGVVFELVRKPAGWHEKIIYTFCSRRQCRDGSTPLAGLTYAGAATGQLYDGTSPLYGTTGSGGETTAGTVFSLTPKTGTKKWIETVLYSFCALSGCPDGIGPDSALYLDSAGNMYETTEKGGLGYPYGTVFEISPNGGAYTESVLYSFCSQQSCTDGEVPLSGVVMDGLGNLFGTTEEGGGNQDGVIFELSPNDGQWQYNIIANLDGTNGSSPGGALLLDSSGNLFGTTYFGGNQSRKGTVFEFNGAINTLYSFCPEKGCPDGKNPVAGVIEDSAGNLYGTTSGGANHNSGTIFELSVQH